MRRLLIFIVVLYVVWRILGIVGRRLRRADEGRPRVRTAHGPGEQPRESRLVACSRCGTLIPDERAFRGPDGAPYCRRECLQTGGPSERDVEDGGAKLPPSAPQA